MREAVRLLPPCVFMGCYFVKLRDMFTFTLSQIGIVSVEQTWKQKLFVFKSPRNNCLMT
jgi:hypothetical protein